MRFRKRLHHQHRHHRCRRILRLTGIRKKVGRVQVRRVRRRVESRLEAWHTQPMRTKALLRRLLSHPGRPVRRTPTRWRERARRCRTRPPRHRRPLHNTRPVHHLPWRGKKSCCLPSPPLKNLSNDSVSSSRQPLKRKKRAVRHQSQHLTDTSVLPCRRRRFHLRRRPRTTAPANLLQCTRGTTRGWKDRAATR